VGANFNLLLELCQLSVGVNATELPINSSQKTAGTARFDRAVLRIATDIPCFTLADEKASAGPMTFPRLLAWAAGAKWFQ
jgi:hypothetical protein